MSGPAAHETFAFKPQLNKIGKNPNLVSHREEEEEELGSDSKTINAVVNALAEQAEIVDTSEESVGRHSSSETSKSLHELAGHSLHILNLPRPKSENNFAAVQELPPLASLAVGAARPLFHKRDKNVTFNINDSVSILSHPGFKRASPTVLYMHGYTESNQSRSVGRVASAFLKRGDHNFILVDWNHYVTFPYVKAFFNLFQVSHALAKSITRMVESGHCSHHRSWDFFAESLLNETAFPAVPCDNWTKFTKGECKSTDTAYMGIRAGEARVLVRFYLLFRLRSNNE
ncbi:hypothetical protein FOCC_FOCC001165 [Frankliniella occidentalis]|nr:hypothetical protein FOCC_FOCC001165 [Frankliniella occidentalis]